MHQLMSECKLTKVQDHTTAATTAINSDSVAPLTIRLTRPSLLMILRLRTSRERVSQAARLMKIHGWTCSDLLIATLGLK